MHSFMCLMIALGQTCERDRLIVELTWVRPRGQVTFYHRAIDTWGDVDATIIAIDIVKGNRSAWRRLVRLGAGARPGRASRRQDGGPPCVVVMAARRPWWVAVRCARIRGRAVELGPGSAAASSGRTGW